MKEQGYAACLRHRVRTAEGSDTIEITGFSFVNHENCYTSFADGCRYHEYGISTGSILLCELDAEVEDKDLVLVDVEGRPTIYQYHSDSSIAEDGVKRILHDKSKAFAKIIGSFNIYC